MHNINTVFSFLRTNNIVSRDGNKENNLAAKVADKLFFYQTNEKIIANKLKKNS